MNVDALSNFSVSHAIETITKEIRSNGDARSKVTIASVNLMYFICFFVYGAPASTRVLLLQLWAKKASLGRGWCTHQDYSVPLAARERIMELSVFSKPLSFT